MPVHYNKATKNEMGVQNICSSTPSCPFELGYGNGSLHVGGCNDLNSLPI